MAPSLRPKSQCTFPQSSGAKRTLDFTHLTSAFDPDYNTLQRFLQIEPADVAAAWKHTNGENQGDEEECAYEFDERFSRWPFSFGLRQKKPEHCEHVLPHSPSDIYLKESTFYWAECRGDKSVPILVPCLHFCCLSATVESGAAWLV